MSELGHTVATATKWQAISMADTGYELAALRDVLAAQAVAIGDVFEKELDYSIESVSAVEEILAEISDEYFRTQDGDGLDGVAMQFGAYLIKTVEQNFDAGVWQRDHPELGQHSFPYYWRGRTLFPAEWCRKRIYEGTADNIVSKFQTLVIGTSVED